MSTSFVHILAPPLQADVLDKLKEMICEHKQKLIQAFEQADSGGASGAVAEAVWARVLRSVISPSMPWENYIADLATTGADGSVLHSRGQ